MNDLQKGGKPYNQALIELTEDKLAIHEMRKQPITTQSCKRLWGAVVLQIANDATMSTLRGTAKRKSRAMRCAQIEALNFLKDHEEEAAGMCGAAGVSYEKFRKTVKRVNEQLKQEVGV